MSMHSMRPGHPDVQQIFAVLPLDIVGVLRTAGTQASKVV
jgi:hypothetical protein